MKNISRFQAASRHYAVQALFNACYAETLLVTARFLKREKPACTCRPADVARSLQADGLLPQEGLDRLRERCQNCRQSLERAVLAWEDGNADELRARLVDYRQATGAVRQTLVELTR